MKAIDLINVSLRGVKGIIVLSGKARNFICINGASISGFVGNQQAFTHSVPFAIKKGDEGILAISVQVNYAKNSECYGFFVRIEWNEDQDLPFIDLVNAWLPDDPNRIGRYVSSYIEVGIEDRIYTTKINCGKNIFVDGNSICRYMDGKISAEELKAVSKLPSREQELQDKIATLEGEIAKKNGAIRSLEEASDDLAYKRSELQVECSKMSTLLYEAESQRQAFREALNALCQVVLKKWFISDELRTALKNARNILSVFPEKASE